MNMGEFSKKKGFAGVAGFAGFTLIEVLIVVVIVGLLSSIAIGSYTHYRKASLLELAADNIVSSLYGARDSVRLGKGGGAGDDDGAAEAADDDEGDEGDGEKLASLAEEKATSVASCEGIMFSGQEGGEGGYVKRISTEFDAKKKWIDGGWQILGCVGEVSEQEIELDDLVSVEKILIDGSEVDGCGILFAPPDGDVVLKECVDGDVLEVVVAYGQGDGSSYERIIEIDLKNAIANVKKDLEE